MRTSHPTTWSYTVANPFGMGGSNDITLRGYTFHEHLHHFSLINMNGRLYDYVLGRMLSPDNYVQSPNSTQSFNRYSYCWNNPLKYTDPSGEIVFAAVVGIIAVGSGVINLATNWKNVNSFGDGFYYFGVGAVVGGGAAVGGAALAPVIGTGVFAGAALGGGSGFLTGFANTTYRTGGDWKAGLRDGGKAAIFGAAGGAIISGAIAGYRGNNIWTGNTKTSGLSAFSFKDIANGKNSPSWNFRDAYKINSKEFWKYGRIREGNIKIEKLEISENQYIEDGWDKSYFNKTKNELGLPDDLLYSDNQIGRKFGKHMYDYPELTYESYLEKAKHVYKNPTKIIHYPLNAPKYPGETHFILGVDLLRIDKNGYFRSLYPKL